LNEYQGTDKKEMKAKLTLQIKETIYKLGKSKVDSTKYRYLLAEKLITLSENMGTYNEATEKTKVGRNFYTYILVHFKIGER
jgi:hypothetical protein